MDADALLRFRSAYLQATREFDTLRLRHWEQSRVTLPQLRVLFQIRRTPGVTAGRLSRRLGVTVSTTSELVSKLADRGLLARSTTPGDRRQAPLELTEAGAAEAAAFSQEASTFLAAVAAELGDENLAAVTEALEQLAQAAGAIRAAADSAPEPRGATTGAAASTGP
jgi:DNA-binding MarR family transcriptional regulator